MARDITNDFLEFTIAEWFCGQDLVIESDIHIPVFNQVINSKANFLNDFQNVLTKN